MSGGNTGNGLGGLLGLMIFAAFGAASVWMWLPPNTAQPTTTDVPEEGKVLSDNAQSLAALIAVTTERPLFHASRRPVQAPAAAPAPQAPELVLSLVGVIVDGNDKVALVRISNSPELYRVAAEGRLAEWQILRIGEDFVEVRKGAEDPFILAIDE